MSHSTTSRWLTMLAATAAWNCTPAVAATAIQLNQPGVVFESAPYSLGFAFSVTTDVFLTSLGVYDHLGDGLEAPAEVALWTDGNPNAVLGAVVPAGTTAALDGGFRFVTVAPLRLLAGQVYVVASYLDGGWATSFGLGQQGAASVDSRVNLLADRFGDTFFQLAYADQSDGSAGAWLGANFQIHAVPEPGPAVLLALGLAAMGLRRRSAFSPI